MKLDIGQDVLLELPERANLVGGLKIEHKFSQPDVHPYDLVEWERRNIAIFDFKKGVNAYERNNVEVPKFWDQNAAQTTISKYLFGNAVDTPEYEDSLKHAFDRIANTYTVWGWKHGYFLDTDSAKAFNWELKAMLVNQMWAPNSPVWFNIGHWEQWRWGRPDLRQKLGGNKSFKATLKEDGELEVRELSNAFEHGQMSACFLTGVEDSMESILQHQVAEGRIFSSGSGVGINISTLRSSHEPISGKGRSSGPLSFDKGWDKMAGAIKSGGKTRRAARMVLMDSNHPDIMEFVNLKNEQEQIAKIVLREHNTQVALSGIAQEKLEKGTVSEKLAAQFILSQPVVNKREYSGAMDGEIYGETVSNQNANHSVSLLGDFWDAYANNGNYSTRWVTQPDKIAATFKAEELLKAMAQSVYDNAEPGCHNNDWINLWSPYKSEERLTTSNPCITGDSLVAGQGLAPIQDLVGKTPRVKGLDGKLHKAVKVFKTGTKPVYRLTTKFGYHLDITKDHKIPVVSIETVDGERVLRSHLDIPVAQLRKGDFVHLQGANPGTKKISIELGRLAGFAAACGYVLTDGSLALNFGTAHEAAKEARKIVSKITDTNSKLVQVGDKFSLALKDKKILKQLGTLLTLTPGSTPQLAGGARSLATRELGDMISAIFDVSANVEKNKIVLKNKAELVTQVQILLLTFGIKAKVLKNRLELKSNNSYLFSRTIRFDAPSKRKAANALKPINLIEASIHQKLDDLPNLDQVESVTLLGNEEVYDLTEPVTSHFVANGIVIHNCSEYLAPINTSCNLSSFNAYRFLDRETKEIKTDLLEHGALLAMLVADLNVEEGGFPVPEIARATYQYRTTGIGFGNIGGLLMSLGIPYDSDEGRWLAGTLTSFLTAACWKASYKMGNEYGAYLKYETNKNDLTKVLDLHVASDSLLSKLPHINKDKAEEIISRGPNSTLPSWGSLSGRSALRALVESFDLASPWDEVMIKTTRKLSSATTNLWRDIKKEMKTGQPRNSFTNLVAPGGTISAPLGIYDEGTTAAEPDYTLVKYKVLAGGGMLRMFNRLALEGLRTIGYSEWHVKEAALEVAGLNGLYVACQADADAVTRHLVMPTMDKPGPVREAYSQLDPNSPSYLEPSEMVRRVASGKSEGIADLILNGKGHVENIPWLPTHHIAIFDCAATSSDGKRAIEALGHIKMLGALQPFISGAVSKCITGDSIVTTSKGLQRVGGLYNGEKPDTFSKVDFTVPGPNKPEQATNFYYGGTKSVWEVELEDGRKIKGTRVHRLRTAGENGLDWTQTPDLSPGDWVALQLGAEMWGPEKLPSNVPLDASYGSQNMFREPSQKQITDVCLFLGMLTADGHLTRSNYVVGLTKNEPQVLNKFQSLLKSLFGLQAHAVTDARNGVTSIQIGSKSLQQWLDGVGFSKENIPDWILGGSRRMALAYLSGLFLDGWISQTGDIAISQRHQSLTRDVQAIFDNLGISTYFSDNVVNEVNYPVLHVLGKDRKKAARTLTWIEAKKRTRAKSVKAAEDREIFPLHRNALKEAIRAKKQTSDFREVFDPRTKYIQTSTFLKAAKAVGFNFDKEALSYRYVRVSGVRYAGEQEVFDLSVPSTEQFVANGIVNHNTVNLPYYATTDEILDCFVKSHKMGVKCIALYRADSKGVSVYQSSSPESQRWTTDQVWKTITSSIQEQADEIVQKASVPKRRKLHDRRWSQVVKFGIAGQGNLEGYLIVGVYPDGTCGEVFGKLGQGGSFAHGMFESFCKAFSVMLQWGVPFQQATSTFRSMAFDPSGFVKVGDPDSEHGRADIKSCKSVIDLVMQILKWMFPEENNYRIKSLQSSKLELGAAAVEISNATPTSSQTTPVSGNSNAVVDLSSAETCPECGSLSVIQDGRCRKCTHCGYSSGGCS